MSGSGLVDIASPVVVDALTRMCDVCGALPGLTCTYSGTMTPLRGKRVHVRRTKSDPPRWPASKRYTKAQLSERPLFYLCNWIAAVRPCHVEAWRARVLPPDGQGCMLWDASIDANGYGQFRINPTMVKAHQIGWVLANGPIPLGLELDHLCRRPSCCNPKHLEAVTREENIRRIAERATHCRSGRHRWDEQEPVMRDGKRNCRPCVEEYRENFNRLRRERRAASRSEK